MKEKKRWKSKAGKYGKGYNSRKWMGLDGV